MPLDPYLTPKEKINLLNRARNIGAAACMRSLGFRDWTPDIMKTVDTGSPEEVDLFEYLDPATVSREGYPRSAGSASPEEQDKPSGRRAPTEEEYGAYTGSMEKTRAGLPVPPGGCGRVAEKEIFGEDSDLPVDPRALAVDSRTSAMTDSRTRRAIDAWKACMAESDLEYDSPVVPPRDIRWASRDAATPASDEEKRIAGIDAACQRRVNLVGVYKAVRIAYEERLLRDNESALRASVSVFEKWVDNARRVIAKGY